MKTMGRNDDLARSLRTARLRVTREGVHLEGERPGLHARVVIHRSDGVVDGPGEYPDTAHLGAVGNRQHRRQYAVVAQPEVAPAVLPDNRRRRVVGEVRALLGDDNAVSLRGG